MADISTHYHSEASSEAQGTALTPTIKPRGEQPVDTKPCQEIVAVPPGDPYTVVTLSTDNPNAIRLLRILPGPNGNNTAPIACELHHGTTSDSYIALSYMWGTAEATEIITLNGLFFQVRRNLWNFLCQRRMDERRTKPQYLWIDALCIDQESTLERNHQVGMMGRIYSSATLVIAWLGSESELLKVFDYLNEFASDTQKALGAGETKVSYSAILRLYKHAYWNRAWILQECVLAVKLQVQCGSRQFPSSLLTEHARASPTTPLVSSSCVKVLHAREKWHDTSVKEYFCPWSKLWLLKCSDSRDRIYSAIAIMDPRFGIVPDYSKTVSELFFEIAEQHIEWTASRWGDIYRLAYILGLSDSLDPGIIGASPAVRQILGEAYDFAKSGKTKSEFLTERSLQTEVNTLNIITDSSEDNWSWDSAYN